MFKNSLLQKLRISYSPKLPEIFRKIDRIEAIVESEKAIHFPAALQELFPHLCKQPSTLRFVLGSPSERSAPFPQKVGVVFSGGPAAGGHNVICGLYDVLKALHPESQLVGFCDGPQGLISNVWKELTAESLLPYRNQGGFNLLGSGRTKIETPEQFAAVETHVRLHALDGLVIIGGDDSNTNAAWLAEFFLNRGCKTRVIGVPKTIDGDLKSEEIEISFGFSTATRTYAEIIGNIMKDTLSTKKMYYFIKLMGRSASHITLECALQTHPNIALIGEEIAEKKKTFSEIVTEISDMICRRAEEGKAYGVILIPEGLIEFIPEFRQLLTELNGILDVKAGESGQKRDIKSEEELIALVVSQLSSIALSCFQTLPFSLKKQLLLDRDPHGNVQVSKIETERLFMEAVAEDLERRKRSGLYKKTFNGQPLFLGYEGRSALPTNFDAQYCTSLGHVAALLLQAKATGYICYIKGLAGPVEKWQAGGKNLVSLMHVEKRGADNKVVIQKALVDLKGKPFQEFLLSRDTWRMTDSYCFPGPIQFFGPQELTDAPPRIMI
jgi:pyrophosphate--fructose-6-phosphate 1-phosphotransferase